MGDVTRILQKIEQGDPQASDQLLPILYEELRKLAAAKLAREGPAQTLQATALVHEAYLRLVGDGSDDCWQSRGHFFGAAAEAMRRILVENARRKNRVKHGGGRERIALEPDQLACALPDEDLLALDEALNRLAAESPAKAHLIQLRFFAGLTNEQAAAVLGISGVTAKRHWRYARAWLLEKINSDSNAAGGPDFLQR